MFLLSFLFTLSSSWPVPHFLSLLSLDNLFLFLYIWSTPMMSASFMSRGGLQWWLACGFWLQAWALHLWLDLDLDASLGLKLNTSMLSSAALAKIFIFNLYEWHRFLSSLKICELPLTISPTYHPTSNHLTNPVMCTSEIRDLSISPLLPALVWSNPSSYIADNHHCLLSSYFLVQTCLHNVASFLPKFWCWPCHSQPRPCVYLSWAFKTFYHLTWLSSSFSTL